MLAFILCFTSLLQVKALTEEATNRKALIESLKRRLNVATAEKSQYETSCAKLKEDMGKKVGHGHATKALFTFNIHFLHTSKWF